MTISRIKIAQEGPEFSRLVYGAWRLTDRAEETTTTKVREKIDNAVKAAKKAAETARQKAEIAISR